MQHYVITGCAGSGTKWASLLMTNLGSQCGHQRVFRVLGVQPWREHEGDSSFFAVGQIDKAPEVEWRVVKLIRNPLHVVRSLDQMSRFLTKATRDDTRTFDYIGRTVPHVLDAQDRLGRILRYVAWWDALTEPVHTLFTDRCTADEVYDMYQYATGRAPARDPRDVMRLLGNTTNTHNGDKSAITWDDIRVHPDGQPVIDKANWHGYETSGNDE